MKMSLSPQMPSSHSLRDPSTLLQRPTSAKIPDVSHLLNSIFGDKYNKEKLSVDVVKNLSISSDVDNQYHKRYVQKLKEAQLVKESRIQEYAMLEKHILEAQAKALAYEDREEDKRMKTCQNPDLYGVPPTKSYFSYCLDDAVLKDHNLLVPSDYYFKSKRPFVPMPKNEGSQRYLDETVSSREHFKKKVLPPINSSKNFDIEELGDICKEGSVISDYYDTDIDQDKNLNEKKLNKKPYWKDTLRQEERLNDRDYLKKLENRTKFLTNPRLEATRLGQISKEADLVFDLFPKIINFEKYIIGKVYESTFEIRNTSTVAHQFRAIPPKSQFFSLSLGQYPQGQSLIAPGLSAQFNIRFSPDSLCSFEDQILIECSNGSKALLPLIAKRESPCLTSKFNFVA